MWLKGSEQPVLSASRDNNHDTPSTSDSMVKSQKSKVKNTCLLCKDMHLTYLCPHMDEASKLLEYMNVPRHQISTCYCKLSLDPTLVD